MNSPINDENILNVVYKYTSTSELELQLASVSDENVYQSVPSTYSAFFSQSESAFLNTTNHYQMTQYENGGAVKENPIQPLKRKLSVPDQLWHANGSFEDSHVSLRKRIKSSKRTPVNNSVFNTFFAQINCNFLSSFCLVSEHSKPERDRSSQVLNRGSLFTLI